MTIDHDDHSPPPPCWFSAIAPQPTRTILPIKPLMAMEADRSYSSYRLSAFSALFAMFELFTLYITCRLFRLLRPLLEITHRNRVTRLSGLYRRRDNRRPYGLATL